MVICYRCHKYKELNDFYCSSDDPLAQVCGECKVNALDELKKELRYWNKELRKCIDVYEDSDADLTAHVIELIKRDIKRVKEESKG